MKKRKDLFRLLAAFFVLSLVLNAFLLFSLAPRKAISEEITKTQNLLIASQKKRQCVPGTNFLKLFPFIDAVNKRLENHKEGRASAVISLDGDKIGKFKKENGDEATEYIMSQLLDYVEQVADKEKDVVICTLGEQSDEIVIFVPDRKSEQEIVDFTEKLLEGWKSKTIKFNEDELHITISAGIAFYPQHGINSKELYMKADAALQQAKNAGRGRYAIFEEN